MAYSSRDAMRPAGLKDFTGQPAIEKQLAVVLGSARSRGALPDHMLFSGPPGLGKTTLAHIVANELELPITTASGPSLETPADVLSLLQSRTEPGVVFVDEIHRMSRVAEETLYPALEDGEIPIRIGEGPTAEHVMIPVMPFTLVAATTQVGLLSAPLRDRFGFQGLLHPYGVDALTDIVRANARKMSLTMDAKAARAVASRSRGTPRVANSLLSRVRDVAEVEGVKRVSQQAAEAAMDAFGVDTLGIDQMGRRILEVLCTQFGGGPVGLTSLASAVGETTSTIESVYEPLLMATGLMQRTPQGRVATVAAYAHIGLDGGGANGSSA